MMNFHILCGRTGATMQNIGTPSTPASAPPRFGIPAAPPGEPSRSSMMEAYSVLAASRNAVNPGKEDSYFHLELRSIASSLNCISPSSQYRARLLAI